MDGPLFAPLLVMLADEQAKIARAHLLYKQSSLRRTGHRRASCCCSLQPIVGLFSRTGFTPTERCTVTSHPARPQSARFGFSVRSPDRLAHANASAAIPRSLCPFCHFPPGRGRNTTQCWQGSIFLGRFYCAARPAIRNTALGSSLVSPVSAELGHPLPTPW